MRKIYTILFYFTLVIVVVSAIFTSKMMAIANISIVLLSSVITLKSIIEKKNPQITHPYIVLSFFGIFLGYIIGNYVSDESFKIAIKMINQGLIFFVFGFLISLLDEDKIVIQRKIFSIIYVLVVVFAAVWSLKNYIFAYDIYSIKQFLSTNEFLLPKYISNGVWHHTFSFYITIAIVLCFGMLLGKDKIAAFEKYFYLFSIIFLSFVVHLLMCRWSIISLYIFYIFIIYKLIFSVYSKKIVLILLFILVVFGTLIAKYPPNFLIGRIAVTQEGYKQLFIENPNPCDNFGGRLFSFKYGLLLLNEKPLTGYSFSGHEQKFDEIYQKMNLPKWCWNRIHNQFLSYAVFYGLPVSILISFSCFFICFMRRYMCFVIFFPYFFLFSYSLFDTPLHLFQLIYFFAMVFPFILKYYSTQKTI
ncbi:MAG: O-antigen ligase domain-containing protein [Bacteroidetes bacterium]|nr:MAG: O-antigen ligase domain-containing protein [Bacteroidota bacterium]